ncbi:MAG: hypothetical protein AAFZ18_18280 [Myxococcota bacterium]
MLGLVLAGCGNDNGGPLPESCPLATFEDIHAMFNQPRCANGACHGGAGVASSGRLDLAGDPVAVYAQLVGVATQDPEGAASFPLRVEASSSTTSYLFHMLEAPAPLGSRLGRMPPGGQIRDCELAALREWIEDGAPPPE